MNWDDRAGSDDRLPDVLGQRATDRATQRRQTRRASGGVCVGLLVACLLHPTALVSGQKRPVAGTHRHSVARSCPAPGGLVGTLAGQAPGLRTDVLQLALDASACAAQQGAVTRATILTVIDYSRPSTKPRLWVLDLDAGRVLFAELVAHGRNSGENQTMGFSNRVGSLESSLGLFVTGGTYTGRKGYSLRLLGLEKGINDLALERGIVIHGASYVNDDLAKRQGRLGRSWGCPVVRISVARALIDTIKGGSAVFSYYPDDAWLASSGYLHGCGGMSLLSDTPGRRRRLCSEPIDRLGLQ